MVMPGDVLQFDPANKTDAALRFLAELVTISARRSYRPGWLFHTFEARFGRRPSDTEIQQARQAPQEPSSETLGFVMAKHRRFATQAQEPPAEAPPVKATPGKKPRRKTAP